MVAAVNLKLRSEVVLILVSSVSSKIDAGLHMSDQNWLTGSNGLALHFKSNVRVDMVDNPDSISAWPCSREVGQLLLGKW